MKKMLYFVAVFSLTLLLVPNQLNAQTTDTVDVAALPPGNINEVIAGDTTAGGERANPNAVYRLKRGSVYQVTEAMKINGSVAIIAEDGDGRPPVLAPAILPDNSSIDHFFDFIGYQSKVELRNLYFTSFRADDTQLGWSDGMRINADSLNLVMHGCTWDGFSHSAIHLHSWWCKMDVQDCMFRNEMHGTSWFGGGAFLSDAGPAMDTVRWINNSFFCNNSYLWSIRGYSPYAEFSHNSVVLSTVNPFLIRQAPNLIMKNNLFYASHAMGGNPTHVYDGWFLNWPDTASSSIIRWRDLDSTSYWAKLWASTITGPEAYENPDRGVTADLLAPSARVFDVQNNSYLFPQKMVDFYNAYNDTVQTQDSILVPNFTADEVSLPVTRKLIMPTWMSEYTMHTLDTLDGIADITVSGNMEMDPGFNTDVTNQLDSLLAYVLKISTGTLDVPWFYKSADPYPPAWPLNEDLAYSNTSLQSAGTDGFAVGDLNWFPDQKANWLTGVETISNEIPAKMSLSQAYPNPFNPSTNINVSIAKSGNISLRVYNVLGQLVKTIVNNKFQKAGEYKYNVDMSNFSSGVYLYRLEQGNNSLTKRMILLK